MFDKILQSIRRRTKSEWQVYYRERVELLRSYIRENGEKASLLGFIFGIAVVVFYKLALLLACLGLIAAQTVILLAEEKSE